MKNYEWSNKHTSIKKCPECGKELEFADMKCPYCGRDVRTEQRKYNPGLSSSDIQPGYRDRAGAPEEPQGSYYMNQIGLIGFMLTAGAIAVSVFMFFLLANIIENGSIVLGLVVGICTALLLIPAARAVVIGLKNGAAAARNSERTALDAEYQVQQLNEMISTYNKDKDVEAENMEIFAKLLVKISKLEEAQKKASEETANILSAMSRKLNRDFSDISENERTERDLTELIDEEEQEKENFFPETSEVEVDFDVSEEETEEVIEEITEEIADEEPSDDEDMIIVPEAEEYTEEAKEYVEESEEIPEEAEEYIEEPEEYADEEEYVDEEEYTDEEEYVDEEEYTDEEEYIDEEEYNDGEEDGEEYVEEEEYEEYDADDDRFDELFDSPEEDIYLLVCPKCMAEYSYTEDQIRNGEMELVCEICGTQILSDEDDEEEEEEPAYDARSAYEKEIEENDEPKDRLGSLLDGFDEE